MKFRLRLRGKFIVLISSLLVIIFALVAVILVNNNRTTLTENLNSQTRAFAALATRPIGDAYDLYQQSGTARIGIEIQNFTTLDSAVANVGIVDGTGATKYALSEQPPVSISLSEASSFDPIFLSNSQGQLTRVIEPYLSNTGQHPFAVVYVISTSTLEQAIARGELVILILALLGLIVSAIATYEFTNYFFLHPIERVSTSAQLIAAGNYNQQITATRKDEIGDLSLSVNHMAETLKADITKLQDLDRLKTEFIRITSHNLRTPLTIIDGYVSLLENAKLNTDVRDMIDKISDVARTLSIFSEQMLTIASIESGDQLSGLAEVSLDSLIKPLMEEFEFVARAKEVKFESKVEGGDAKARINQHLVTGAVNNLVDNAIKFTPKGGKVVLGAKIAGDQLVITVTDTGAGIKAEEIPKLFTKFHRGTDVLTYNFEGTGIGLYVVKLIVEQHGGSVKVESQEGQGATFTMTLPVAGPAAKA